ncbi:hypothetical protein ROHU_026322 [Labeo rohita]|uniref:Uncharacterized protein n=1 Tax=Labeo rohita TaxID=84645 RepID=A0A498MAR2_LABRO|nr:hypothetical protein ROHU_026322 [Labeo rohita]
MNSGFLLHLVRGFTVQEDKKFGRTLRSALDSSGSCNGALSTPTTPNPTSADCPPDDSLAAAGQHFLPGPLCAEPTLVLHQAYTNDSSFK